MEDESRSEDQENNLHKELPTVLFPGVVHDETKAIECLGGLSNVAQVWSEASSKRLGLSLSPHNPYSKQMFADLHPTAGLLLRVRVRRKKGKPVSHTVSVVGRVTNVFEFTSLSDFSVLPLAAEKGEKGETEMKCVLEKFIPSGLDDVDWLNEPAPRLIVPLQLTRTDKPQPYRYSEKKFWPVPVNPDKQVHVRMRPNRNRLVTSVNFDDTTPLPTAPQPAVLRLVQARLNTVPGLKADMLILQKALEERPMWCRNSLKFHTGVSHVHTRMLLPALALYLRRGPWRQCWARFGYDPRAHPDAARYQLFDFRINNSISGGKTVVGRKRFGRNRKNIGNVRPIERRNPFGEDNTADEVCEADVLFTPGSLPTGRQNFYQICDIRIDGCEELVRQSVLPAYRAGAGWLPGALFDRLRQRMVEHTRRAVLTLERRQASGDEAGTAAEAAWSGEAGAAGAAEENSEGGPSAEPHVSSVAAANT